MTTMRIPARPTSSPWAAYAAAGWAIVFAVRGAYWALGGEVGLGTLSSGIQQAAGAGDPSLFAALWASIALELLVAGLALALVRPWGRTFARWLPAIGGRPVPHWLLLTPAWGAGAVLAGHGGLFIAFGVIAAGNPEGLTSEVLWYSLFWGPWFLLGGILFMAAGAAYLRTLTECRRGGVAASVLGALGGMGVTGAQVVMVLVA